MLKLLSFHRDSKASVAVEFALISTFFLFPLFSGVTDCVEIISAQAQLNTAAQALYYNAWTNLTTATATTKITTATTTEMQAILNTMSANGMTNITLGSVDGTVSYGCYIPPSTVVTYQSSYCPSYEVQQRWVNYQVNATVNLTFPFPGLNSQVPLTATGKVETD